MTDFSPALTATEWRDWLSPEFAHISIPTQAIHLDRHALAALCLVGQPFGFTHEDINLLHRLVLVAATLSRDDFLAADGLAGRIKALLPPQP